MSLDCWWIIHTHSALLTVIKRGKRRLIMNQIEQPKDYCTTCGKETEDVGLNKFYTFCSEECYGQWYKGELKRIDEEMLQKIRELGGL